MSKPIFADNVVQKQSLHKLIEIPPQGTISKGLLETNNTKTVLFGMDEGQSISDHRSVFPATLHVWEGEIIINVEGTDYKMVENDFLFMPPNAVHRLNAIRPAKFLLTLMKNPGSEKTK